MAEKLIHLIQTGGTIGMSKKQSETLDVDPNIQKSIVQILEKIPFTTYKPVDVKMKGDSSNHPRPHYMDLGQTALDYASEKDGIIIAYGTDTMNLAACTLALMGNEMWRFPVVFLGSIKDLKKEDTDAPKNAITAGLFASYGDASGVFAVRPNGVVITSRHDTPGGSINWHSRGLPQAENAFFARVDLEKLVDKNNNLIFKPTSRKQSTQRAQLSKFIKLQRDFMDGTLDYADQVVVGGRGRIPALQILGYPREKIIEFKTRPENDSPELLTKDIVKLVSEEVENNTLVGRVIPYFALTETIKRHGRHMRTGKRGEEKKDYYNKWWPEVLQNLLSRELKIKYPLAQKIVDFWGRHSSIGNDEMDFGDILSIKASTDPDYLYRLLNREPPRMMVIQATGASGLRFHPLETFEKPLAYCRNQEIPVVLTSSSRGEVTSIEYGPGSESIEKDLDFFAGTFDDDLVQPRLALLNHKTNHDFINKLVNELKVNSYARKEIKRNMYRQLLSGSHYKHPEKDEISDRKRVEDLYKIETRVDLLSGLHVKKAILASYLHEVYQRDLQLPDSIIKLL